MQIPNIRNIIDKFCNNCLERDRDISSERDPVYNDPENNIERLSNSYNYPKRKRLIKFRSSAVPLFAWLKCNPKGAVFITDFSNISQAIAESDLGIHEKTDLILYIISTNIENGILDYKTSRARLNHFRWASFGLIRLLYLINFGDGFKTRADEYIRGIKLMSASLPCSLYGPIMRYEDVKKAHRWFYYADKTNKVYSMPKCILDSIFTSLNIDSSLKEDVINYIISRNALANMQSTSKKENKHAARENNSQEKTDEKYTALKQEIARKDELYHKLLRYPDSKGIDSLEDVLNIYREAIILGVADWKVEKGGIPTDEIVSDRFLSNVFLTFKDSALEKVINYKLKSLVLDENSKISFKADNPLNDQVKQDLMSYYGIVNNPNLPTSVDRELFFSLAKDPSVLDIFCNQEKTQGKIHTLTPAS